MGTFDQNKGTTIPGKEQQGDIKRKDQFEHGKDKDKGLGKKPGEFEKR